jgi:hypothetical protein
MFMNRLQVLVRLVSILAGTYYAWGGLIWLGRGHILRGVVLEVFGLAVLALTRIARISQR